MMGSLYGRYDSMWFFWELLNLGSKLLLTSSIFLFSDESSVNALRQVRLSTFGEAVPEELQTEAVEQHRIVGLLLEQCLEGCVGIVGHGCWRRWGGWTAGAVHWTSNVSVSW